MKDSALQAARPRASYDIAREIADMLFLDDGVSASGEEAATAEAGSGGEMGGAAVGNGVGYGYGEALMEAGDGRAAAAAVAGSEERAPERVEIPA